MYCTNVLYELCLLLTGTYIYFQASGAQSGTVTTLQSPTYQLSSHLCQIKFFYHLLGANIGTLSLDLTSGGTSNNLVKYDLQRSDQWYESTQYVGSRSNFQLSFTYVHPGGTYGNAALDDIQFINCNPRVKPNGCATGGSRWQCSFSGECILLDQLCDSVKDCVDGSDEALSMCSGLPGHCDFENGLCGYRQGSNDYFDWLRQSGDTLSFGTGPTFDHTFGTTAGESFRLNVRSLDVALITVC